MRYVAALACLFLVSATPTARTISAPAAVEPGFSVYFSLDGGCTDALVARLSTAKVSIDVQAYGFTSVPITNAISDAHIRRVIVRAVLDRSNQTGKYSGATPLANAGIAVLIDAKHAIAHNKVIIIDGRTLVTGSFNFSKAAEESNAENLLIIDGTPKLVAAYQGNFDRHLAHSKMYQHP
jgi:phosphatidylserine/phosphatidylglycerophosphate/cardiolipin synthase-like enzyme